MKKYFFIASFLLLLMATAPSYAQKFGVRAGVQFPNILVKDDDETYSDENKIKPAFQIGGIVEYPLMDALALEGGLLFSLKGSRMHEEEDGASYTETANLFYLVIPVTAKYSADLGGLKIYGQAGPYFGIGLSGKYKSTFEYEGDKETDTETVEWGNDSENDDLKRPDFGLHIGGGIGINNLQFGLFYELGLANLSPYTGDGFRIKNRTFGLAATFFFGK